MAKAKSKTKKAGKIESAKPDLVHGVLEGIIAACGAESAQLLSDDGLSIRIKGVISTQAATIDAAIGRGGVPRGRLTIIHGDEACGKTTLALHLIAETQRLGGIAVMMDKEYKMDPDYAAALGVDTDRLIISQPPHLEKAFDIWDGIIDRAVEIREKGLRAPILIVLDSMNAAISKSQYDGEWDDKQYAPQARVYSQNLPKLMPKISKEDVAMVWISQMREKMNVTFGNPNTIAGGRAPRFYASLIMEVRRSTADVEDGSKKGNKIIVECKKNQIAPPFRKGAAMIKFGVGYDRTRALIEQAVIDGLVERRGSHYSYGSTKLGQGMAAVKKSVTDDIFYEINKAVEKMHGWER